MKKISLKTAFTLIELIIAIVLIAVVLLGIFAINNVLSNNNQDYGQRYLVKSETQATLNNILNNASSAVGDATGNNPAFLIGTAGLGNSDTVNNPNSFCIDQNPNWVCYTFYGAGTANPYQILSCTMPFVANTSPYFGAASCNGVGNAQFVGTASANPTVSQPSGQSLFSITINNCLNDSLSSCASQNDPSANPYVTVNGSVVPAQVSTS